jgi:hypothetical protein
MNLVKTTSNIALHAPQPLGGGTTPLPIIYYVPLCKVYIQMSFFPRTPNGSPKTRTLVIPKLWMLIFFSNKVFFDNEKEISYSPQKDLSNDV